MDHKERKKRGSAKSNNSENQELVDLEACSQERKDQLLYFRIGFAVTMVVLLALYSFLIGQSTVDGLKGHDCMFDGTFEATRAVNTWFGNNLEWRDILIITNSGCFDTMFFFLMAILYSGVNCSIAVWVAVIMCTLTKAFV